MVSKRKHRKMWYYALQKEEGERSKEDFSVNGEKVDLVAVYKSLGCIISEHLGSKRTLGERAKA